MTGRAAARMALGFGSCKACHVCIKGRCEMSLQPSGLHSNLALRPCPGPNGLEASLIINGGMGLLWG